MGTRSAVRTRAKSERGREAGQASVESWTSDPRVSIGLAVLLVAVTVAVYGHCAGFDYVHWDDEIHIYKNPYVSTLSAANLHRLWSLPYQGLYIPLSYTVYALIAHYSTMAQFNKSITMVPTAINPHPFHIVNIVLHTLNVLLVFALLRKLLAVGLTRKQNDDTPAAPSRYSIPAFFGALLFAIHPLQVESVAWISELRGLLCGFFCIAGLYCYVDAVADPRSTNAVIPAGRWTYWAAFILSILAGLSKPSIAALPVALFAIDRWAAGRSIKSCVASVVPWVLLAAAIVYKTHDAQPVQARVLVPFWTHPFVAGDALAFYFGKVVAPYGLTIDYGRKPQLIAQNWWGFVTWLVPAIVAVIVYRYRKSMPLLSTACWIAVSMLLPVLGLMAFAYQDYSTVADRYVYLAMIGPALALSTVIARAKSPRPLMAGSGVVLAVFAVLSFVQAGHWKDSFALFSYAVQMNPNGYQMREDYGTALKEQGRLDDAVAQYEKCVELEPGYPLIYSSLGLIQMQKGDYTDAITNFRKSIEYQSNLPEPHRNLGAALMNTGDLEGAAAEMSAAVDLDPTDATCRNDYANVLLNLNRYPEAVTQYQAALNLDPTMPEAMYGMAIAMSASGQAPQAESIARRAVELVPNVARAHGALARVLDAEGKDPEAEDEYRKAIALDGNDVMMHYNLACIYFNHRDFADAIPELQQTVRLQPTAAYYDALGFACASTGDKADARDAYEQELQINPSAASAKQALAKLGQ